MKKSLLCIYLILSFVNLVVSQKYKTNIIIIGNGKSYNSALKAKKEFLNQTELCKQLISNVQIISSDTIEGLKPKSYYAIIGFCEEALKTELIVNFTKKFLKHVYSKPVHFENPNIAVYKSPVFMPKIQPFNGVEFRMTSIINSDFLNDSSSFSVIQNRNYSEKVIVLNDTSTFSKKIGTFRVKYYLAWFKSTNTVVYLSQFQFTNVYEINDNITNEALCSEEITEYPMGPWTATRTIRNCVYPNGIKTNLKTEFEYGLYVIHYPIGLYTFEELVNYYIGKGDFSDLLQNNYANGENETDIGTVTILPKKIGIDSVNSWDYIEMKENEIVFVSGSGA